MMQGLLPVKTKEWLYRRGYCTPVHRYMNPDGSATSRVFKLRPKDEAKLSVDVKSLTTPKIAISDSSKYFLFEIYNEIVENLGLKTFHYPLPDGTNDAHAIIVGMLYEDDIIPGLLARKSKRVIV
jgi:predicted TPR repeat methyltransferase